MFLNGKRHVKKMVIDRHGPRIFRIFTKISSGISCTDIETIYELGI
jgi:hypothetical protein